jgi:hypothetical protein
MPSEQPNAEAAKRKPVGIVANIACDTSVKIDENAICILVVLEADDIARTVFAASRGRGAPHSIAHGRTDHRGGHR